MDSDVQFDGLSELLTKLEALPTIIANNAVRGGIQAGCKVLADKAKELVPVSAPNAENARLYGAVMGTLRNSIRLQDVNFSKGWVSGRVLAGSKVAYYAIMVEWGTVPHYIKASKGQDVRFGDVIRKGFQHPGAVKKPFMRPAFDNAAGAAVQAFTDYVKRRIDVENLAEQA